MEDETGSDHRIIILLQIQEPPAVAGCLRIPISARRAIFGREPAKAKDIKRDLRQLLRQEGRAKPGDDPVFLFRPRDFGLP